MRRIFIAIDISDEARNRISDYIGNLRDVFSKLRVGWEKPEKLHLTLKFLGDVGDEHLELVNKAVEKAAADFLSFRLQIGGTGVFPSGKKARVLWLGLTEAEGRLHEIFDAIETECEKLGFAKETRAFNPHLTIARLREPAKSAELVNLHLASRFDPVEFEVRELVVYESKPSPTGSIYQAVTTARIGQ